MRHGNDVPGPGPRFVCPVVLGRGHPLFKEVKERFSLKLVEARTFRSGNVLVTYRPG